MGAVSDILEQPYYSNPHHYHFSRATVNHWLVQITVSVRSQGNYTSLQLSQAAEALNNAHATMAALETDPTLALLWTPDSHQYMEAVTLHQHQDYHCLLNEIEQHAISCQFEIKKMGLPKTGESLILCTDWD